MIYFSDVDVVLKLARSGFLPLLPELLGATDGSVRIQYLASLRTRLSRPAKRLSNALHERHLSEFCDAHAVIAACADIARQEELLRGGMDPGEAMLFAEAEATGGTVVTGDKRALATYARLSSPSQRGRLKVVCWEQLLLRVHRLKGYATLLQGGCEGMDGDGLLRLAFSSGPATDEAHALEAIRSYLGAVKASSGDILAALEL